MRIRRLLTTTISLALGGSVLAQPLAQGVPTDPDNIPGLEVFIEHAEKFVPYARTETGEAYLDAVKSLPNQLRRYLWVDRQFTRAYTEAEYAELDDKQRRGLSFRPVTELAYYMAISERPLIDMLPLDLVVTGTEMESPEGLAGKKVLLYNPRVITQGRLLASLGADVTIVHDQQRVAALYSEPGDAGKIRGHGGQPDGSLRLIRSSWPAEDADKVGTGYDLIIASDWISRGLSFKTAQPPRWITPGRPLRPLAGEPDAFLESVAKALAPGGRFMNYAYGPIQPRVPSHNLPYSDVIFPFTSEMIEKSGLEVLALDADDTLYLLQASVATGYGEPMVREEDEMPSMTSAYTILVKPEDEGASE